MGVCCSCHWEEVVEAAKDYDQYGDSPPYSSSSSSSVDADQYDDPPSITKISSIDKFSLNELATATGCFSESNLIGEGGYAKVYRGSLTNVAQMAAIKLLSGDPNEENPEFKNELEVLSRLSHPNVIRLLGFCEEEGSCYKFLVYEYMGEGSLADHLSSQQPPLDWKTRLDIALGVAKGLQYLHLMHPPTIHRDIKSSNILLDHSFRPKLGDFGLAKWGPGPDDGKSHVTTRVMGTHGYCAPDYYLSGKLNVKSDVYCFGVVMLELFMGRIAFDPDKSPDERQLVTWAGRILNQDAARKKKEEEEGELRKKKEKELLSLIDPRLLISSKKSGVNGGGGSGDDGDGGGGGLSRSGALRFIFIAEMCLRSSPANRPTMSEVVDALDWLTTH